MPDGLTLFSCVNQKQSEAAEIYLSTYTVTCNIYMRKMLTYRFYCIWPDLLNDDYYKQAKILH